MMYLKVDGGTKLQKEQWKKIFSLKYNLYFKFF